MDADTVVALVSTVVAAIIAIAVPGMTFRFTLRQDQARQLREQRAQLYADLLAEAYAEAQWLEHAMASDEARERMGEHFTDLRLPPVERARLGARGTIFGSRAVNRLFNQMQGEGQSIMLGRAGGEEAQMLIRLKIGDLMDKLQAQIRSELGADAIALDGGSAEDRLPT